VNTQILTRTDADTATWQDATTLLSEALEGEMRDVVEQVLDNRDEDLTRTQRREVDDRISEWADDNLTHRVETVIADSSDIVTKGDLEDVITEDLDGRSLITEDDLSEKLEDAIGQFELVKRDELQELRDELSAMVTGIAVPGGLAAAVRLAVQELFKGLTFEQRLALALTGELPAATPAARPAAESMDHDGREDLADLHSQGRA